MSIVMVLALLSCLYPVNAQEVNKPDIVVFPSAKPYNYHEPTKDIKNLDDYTDRTQIYDGWIIDIDLIKIRAKPIIRDFLKNSLVLFSKSLPIKFTKFPAEISSIHLYGSGQKNHTSVILRGEFNDAFIEKYMVKFIQNNFTGYKLSRGNVRNFNKGKIFSNSLTKINNKGNKIKKRVYIGFVNDDFIVLSQSLSTIRSWLYYPDTGWSFSKMNVVNENTFVQFLINVRPTLHKLKYNENADESLYKSVLFKQTKNIYLTLGELNENIAIGALFTAFDAEKAKKVHQILDGIIALSSEKSTNDIYKKMYSNFVNVLDGETVRVGTFLSLETLKTVNETLVQ
jgi:hypothetical protein